MIARYSRPAMAMLWEESAKWTSWARVERAHLEACVTQGLVSAKALGDFDRALTTKSAEDFLRRETETGHDVIAFVAELGEAMGSESGPFLHRGLTSSDVVDTALALRVTEALDHIDVGLMAWRIELTKLAFAHAQTVTIGRTHGIHAEPCSFGQIVAGYAAEASRAHKQVLAAKETARYGKLSGAVGSYSQVTPAFERLVLGTLGLYPEPVATQVVPRDRLSAVADALEAVVAVVERFALNVRHWARTELGEALEPFGAKQKGSSAMPHKRNPVLAENLCGLARMARSYAEAIRTNTALWHERDISHSSVERIAVPDLFVSVDFMLDRVTRLTAGLDVSRAAMERNLSLTGGLWASGTVLTHLVAAGLSRTAAYETVQSIALPLAEQARAGHLQSDAFLRALVSNPLVSSHITESKVSECFDTDRFLRAVDPIFERVFGITPTALQWTPGTAPFPLTRVPSLRRVVAAHVSLQPDVLDTEARAIASDMAHHLGPVLGVRQRKTFFIEVPPNVPGQADPNKTLSLQEVTAYARSVLCNEVMEDLRVEVVQ